MFICMPKTNFIIHFFLEIYILKNPAIWLTDSILAHNLRTSILLDMGLVIKDWWLFPRKTNDKIFQQIQKTQFWGHFGIFFPKFEQKWIFLEKTGLSVFRYSNYLTLCQKSEKAIGQSLRKTLNWQTNRQTDNGDFVGPSVGWGCKKDKHQISPNVLMKFIKMLIFHHLCRLKVFWFSQHLS